MTLDYHDFMMIAYIVSSLLGAVMYIGRMRAALETRIAVLEAGHDAINEDLREIKQDVKELLRAVTS